jgi:Sulfotransferase domain
VLDAGERDPQGGQRSETEVGVSDILNSKRIYSLIPRAQKNAIKRGIAFTRRVMIRPRMVPDFLVIGAQKSGTSSLLEYLVRHGSYLRPLLKDIYFFDKDYHHGLDWYLSFYPDLATKRAAERRVGGRVVTGESATHYLLHPWSPARVRETFPDIRLIVLLRDPVQRALSHYYHNRRSGAETIGTALDAFLMEEERIAADYNRMQADSSFYGRRVAIYSYLARGRYTEQLHRWFRQFPREQILIMCSERFFADTDMQFRSICRFIGIAERSLGAYPAAGQGSRQGGDEKAIAFAQEYFRPHNEALYGLLGERYDWPC